MLLRSIVLASSVLGLTILATGQEPYQKEDESWISLSGTIEDVTADTFLLNYGDGVIKVEMDDWDADSDAVGLLEGDNVRVSGRIDDDLFETTTIEASSVVVESLKTYFYASAADEEDTLIDVTVPVVPAQTVLRGYVTSKSADEFVINTGTRAVRVETEEMGYDPMDDTGVPQVDVGDHVSVSGTMDSDFLEGRELVAESIVELMNHDVDYVE